MTLSRATMLQNELQARTLLLITTLRSRLYQLMERCHGIGCHPHHTGRDSTERGVHMLDTTERLLIVIGHMKVVTGDTMTIRDL